MEEKWYAYWLCGLPGIGNRTIKCLLEHFGSPGAVYRASEQALRPLLKPAQLQALLESRRREAAGTGSAARSGVGKEECFQAAYERLQEQGIAFYTVEEACYPGRLKQIPDPPYGIFVKGGLPDEERLSVAVVGARECSEYGRYVALELGKYLGEQGIQVISGMARGIDSISQTAALSAGGASFGILGCGVDVCYPANNRELYEILQQKGGILSAYPPGTLPKAGHFPPRNRIVSGLADALVVIEARLKSGTLITVDMALEQGREVYAVPGRVTDRLSDGCNRLIAQGAGVFLSPEEFVRELAHGGGRAVQSDKTGKENEEQKGEDTDGGEMADREKLLPILQALDFQPRSAEDIYVALKGRYTLQDVTVGLMELCMQKLAVQTGVGYFCRGHSDC